MFGSMEPAPAPLTPESWTTHEDFLFAIDLFNEGYFWEAHVFWERCWGAPSTSPAAREFLRSLIQVAATCLKIRQRKLTGARKLLGRIQARARTTPPVLLGIDLEALVRAVRSHLEGAAGPPAIELSDATD